MLTLRQRKPGGAWYVRGTVRIGKKTREITEHSTGTAERGLAESYKATLQTAIERELLYGAPAPPRRISWEDAALIRFEASLNKSELSRLGILDLHFEGRFLNDITSEDWKKFVSQVLRGRAVNTVNNYRKTLRNVFRAGGIAPPEFEATRKNVKLIRWLSIVDADRLMAAYPARYRPAAIIARYQGMRAGEISRLERRDIDFERRVLHVRITKSGPGRFLPLHPVVAELLIRRFQNDGDRHERVILNKAGEPLPDPRLTGHNPFDGAHRAALRKIGMKDFRFHDWRHHWASWFLFEGGDIRSLLMLGGWSSLKEVEPYLAADLSRAGEHQARMA